MPRAASALTGVVATRTAREPSGPPAAGLALISVDGKPPQAYRVGDALDPQFTLSAVGLRSARVTAGGADAGFLLELPPPTPPATGVPMSAGGGLPSPADMSPPGLPPGARPAPPTMAPPYPSPGQGMPPGMAQPGMMTPPGMSPTGGAELDGRQRLETQ